MKLEDIKKQIDDWFESQTDEELSNKWDKYDIYSPKNKE